MSLGNHKPNPELLRILVETATVIDSKRVTDGVTGVNEFKRTEPGTTVIVEKADGGTGKGRDIENIIHSE